MRAKSICRAAIIRASLGTAAWMQAVSTVKFAPTSYTVPENAGAITLNVLRTEDTDTVVSVDYASTNLTASASLDYAPVVGTLVFAAGQTNKRITVPILHDAMVEGTERFTVTLGNPSNAVLGLAVATVSIKDNDTGFQFEFASYSVDEEAGFVLIGVVRGDDGNLPTSVDFATTNGTAIAASHYTPVNGTPSFAAGEAVKLFTVPVLNNGLKEGNKTFRVTLNNPTNQVLGTPKTATVTILDNDPGIQFKFSAYWVQESEGALIVRVLRGNDVDLSAFTVDYATTNLTAMARQDYTETQGTLAFAKGETVKVLTIPITDDQLAEPDEKFTVTLANATGSAALGKTATATVTILDTTSMVAHRFVGIDVLPNQGAQLTLGGGVHQRFKDYFDLYPVEVSTDLVNWTPLVMLQRTNSSAEALTCLDPGALNSDHRFYRTATNHLITPFRRPSGPFPVGMLSRLLTDPTRRNRYGVSTNGSFMASIWYPAVAEAGKLPGPVVDPELSHDPGYWTGSLIDRRSYCVSYSLPDVACATHQAPYPVVIYSHGFTGHRQNPAELAPNLASQGYAVVAVDHWDAYGTVFPDGTYLQSHVPFDTSLMTTDGLQDRIKDLRLVLDELARWNNSDPAFVGRLDLTKVAAMGMSWGGGSAGEFGRIDDRVKAVLLLDPWFQTADDLVREGLPKPFLGMYSTELGGDTTLYNHRATHRAVWLMIGPSRHDQFQDQHWLSVPSDLQGGREVARTINAYSLWFLNKYLKGLDGPVPTKADYPRVTGLKQK